MLMTPSEIARTVRLAKNPSEQVKILAELNLCKVEEIIEALRSEGIKVRVTPRGGRKAARA